MPMSKFEEGELLAQVLAVVNRYDFCGLQPGAEGGPPLSEYELEARPMESILVNHGRIEVADIRAIWQKWFDDDLSGREPAVASLADELNALVSGNRRSLPAQVPAIEHAAEPKSKWWGRRLNVWGFSAVVAVVALAGATLFATAVAGSWTARTNDFKGTDPEVREESVWVDITAPDAPEVIGSLYPAYLLVPSGLAPETVSGLVGEIWGRIGGAPGDSTLGAAAETTAVHGAYESVARCAWYRSWFQGEERSDTDAMDEAAAALKIAARWPATVATDGGGIVEALEDIAGAAANGDRREVYRGYKIDACAAVTGVVSYG